jgi:uncharacterized protein (TIGR02145 family)
MKKIVFGLAICLLGQNIFADSGSLSSKVMDKYGNVYKTVKSPYTGKIWLDRNLGAKRVCTSFDDEQCYGDYFQWGRDADGHEKQNSPITNSLSSSSTPNHSKYIIADSSIRKYRYDWLESKNYNLWQGVNGQNNPCPKGFRIPTIDELTKETIEQGIKSADGMYKSFFKFPGAGFRAWDNDSMGNQGRYGHVWSSTIGDVDAFRLTFVGGEVYKFTSHHTLGYSVRCLKD